MEIRNKFIIRIPVNSFKKEEISNLNEAFILQKFREDNYFREAILIASPELFFVTDGKKNIIGQKEILSLAKYYIRSCTRPTPFGIFSGICLGDIEKTTDIVLTEREHFLKFCRYDTSLIFKIISRCNKLDFLGENNILLFPNNTIYKILDYYFYTEPQNSNGIHCFVKNSIEADDILDKIISKSQEGLTVNDVIKLIQDENYDYDTAYEYVNDLIANKILISELEISTLGGDSYKSFLNKLKINLAGYSKSTFWEEMKKISEDLEKSTFDINNIKNYKYGFEFFKSIEPNKKNIFQTDTLIQSYKCSLSIRTVNSLKSVLPVIAKFSRINKDPLLDFKVSFLKKFESEEVPLLKALDKDLGINFSDQEKFYQPLFNDLSFKRKNDDYVFHPFKQKDELLQEKLCSYFMNGNLQYLEITDSDIASLYKTETTNYPSLSALLEIFDDKIFVEGFLPDATKLTGRFSYMDDNIYCENKNIFNTYSSKLPNDIIFAEISHLVSPRDGNVIIRKPLSEYEIPIICNSKSPKEKTINLKDITVRLRDNKFLLRRKQDLKRVIPIISCSHNVYKYDCLGIYKFLVLLNQEYQGVPLSFDWGVLREGFTFLPRVVYKNFILSKASWKIRKKQIVELINCTSENKLLERMNAFRNEYNIPEEFVVKEFDNFLYIKSSNTFFIKLFIDVVKNKDWFIIEEFLFSKEKSVIFDKSRDMFTNQFIVNMTNCEI